MFELCPVNRAPLPLSFAVAVVLVRAATPVQFALIIGIGYLVAVIMRLEPARLFDRVLLLAERIAEGYAIRAAYRLVTDATNRSDTRALVLAALAAAAIAPIIVADFVTFVRQHRFAAPRLRGADLALITSSMLMAVG